MEKIIFIPSQFRIEPFYDNSLEIRELNEKSKLTIPFYNEINIVNQICNKEELIQNAESLIIDMIDYWKEIKPSISEMFRMRKKEQAKDLMISCVANMISILSWMNQVVILDLRNLQVEINKLPIKPLNFQERLSFLLNQPNHYHSLIQLTGLYEEIEKQYYKQKIKR
ncbi:hypothetical protein J5Y03_03150 [Bacillus sp. RG28]|uniref:YpoC-like domain-containing protein n=1 Tax=Gottfriedia endophytica TaxID=2820819 RepID=A0A940NMI7_9BACI|nr:hypothetical protein [Gottfriedia endophytica]MBP0724178.1 hypothetical protein [Gottfriedia endophytica]